MNEDQLFIRKYYSIIDDTNSEQLWSSRGREYVSKDSIDETGHRDIETSSTNDNSAINEQLNISLRYPIVTLPMFLLNCE